MLFYHVVCDNFQDQGRQVIYSDLLEEELNKYFVWPFLRKKYLTIKGQHIIFSDIKKPSIYRSDRKLEEVLIPVREESLKNIDKFNRENRENSVMIIGFGVGWNDYEIEDYADNVTANFLNKSENFTLGSFWNCVSNNPALSGIIATVVGGVFLLFLGKIFF